MGSWAIRASVTSGRGLASVRMAHDIETINRILGLSLRKGSLNLVSRRPIWFDPQSAIFRHGTQHFWKGCLNEEPVILNRWTGCPAHVFEIFGKEHFRSKFNLVDGNVVCLSGEKRILDETKNASVKSRLAWYALWGCRETMYYKSDLYLEMQSRPYIRRRFWRAFQ